MLKRMVLCTICMFALAGCGGMSKALLIEPPAPDPCTQLSLRPCRVELPQDSIHFTFCQPDSAQTELRVVDVTGKVLAVPLDSALCPDWYTVAWSTHELVSGVYFVTLSSNGKRATKKFVIRR